MEKKEIFTMEAKRSLSGREKFAYGIGAVGKDMVYMLSTFPFIFWMLWESAQQRSQFF